MYLVGTWQPLQMDYKKNISVNSIAAPSESDDKLFNHNISILEVKRAVDSANRGKACGFDNLPTEVLKNDTEPQR